MLTALDRRAARHGLLFLAALSCMGLSESAFSGSFSVSPIRVTLSTGQKIAALRVLNSGTTPMSIQLELLNWSQEQGVDHFSPTTDLLAMPPIFTVPPGESQIVRVGLRRVPDPQRELSYRLFLQELPAPLPEGFRGMQVTLRLGVPVFVTPSAPTVPQLEWRLRRTPKGLVLSTINQGNAQGQVSDLQLRLRNGKTLPLQDPVYVLAGVSREWSLEAAAGLPVGEAVELSAKINGTDITSHLRVE
ncbi:fimbrial biogenesis chaperone [Azotobacter armeniacus]